MAMAAIRAVIWRGSGSILTGHSCFTGPFGVFLVDNKLYGLGLAYLCFHQLQRRAWAAGLFGA